MKKLAVVLAVAFSGVAFGQAGELWFNFGVSELANNGIGTPYAFGGTSSDYSLASDWRFSLRFDFNQGEHFGHEIQYAYNRTALKDNIPGACGASVASGLGTTSITAPTSCSQGMAFHQGGYNFLYYMFTKDNAKIRPFGTAGFQFDDFVPPGSSGAYGGGSNKIGANFGVGVKVHLHGIWAARVDAREYFTGKPSFGLTMNNGLLWQTELSAGVGIGF
jgi:hypothetical protein